MTRAENAEHWRGVVTEQKNSGLSVAAFCRERSLKMAQVLRWRRHFAAKDAGTGDGTGGMAGFVELVRQDATAASPSGISIQVGDRISIRLARGFDPATLKAVLSAVREVAA